MVVATMEVEVITDHQGCTACPNSPPLVPLLCLGVAVPLLKEVWSVQFPAEEEAEGRGLRLEEDLKRTQVCSVRTFNLWKSGKKMAKFQEAGDLVEVHGAQEQQRENQCQLLPMDRATGSVRRGAEGS